MNSMKRILLYLLLCLSISATAQVSRTAVFDFADPTHLTPVVTPTSEIGADVEITGTTFTNKNISISFTKGTGTLGARCVTNQNLQGSVYYYLQLCAYATMTFSCPSDATIEGVYFSDTSTKGGLHVSNEDKYGALDGYDGTYACSWTNKTGSDVQSIKLVTDGTPANIRQVTIKYKMPSAVLVPTPSIEEGATVGAFEKLDLTFDNSMSIVSTEGITLSCNGATQTLSATVSGNTVTLSPSAVVATDGTYTLTVPAGCFSDAEGFVNKALTYTFKVETPKNIFRPVSISPAQGKVETLSSPITLVFGNYVGNVEAANLVLMKDGVRKAPLKAARKEGDSKSVELSFDILEGISEEGTYTVEIPEKTIYDIFNELYNPALTLTYTIGGTAPDPEPAEDTETMKAAKALLLKQGVGYPAENSAARVALANLTTASPVPSDTELQTAIDNFYKETNVTLPATGKYYQVCGVNNPSAAESSKLYLAYDGSAVTLTSDKSEAATFEATQQADGTVSLQTKDGKWLHVLVASNNHDLTSSKNVTDSYLATVNNLTLAKLAVDGVDAGKTFGLFSMKGALGKKNIVNTEEEAFALIDYSNKTVATDPDFQVYFQETYSSAFVLTEVEKPLDIATVETAYTLTPKEVSSNTEVLTLTFTEVSDVAVSTTVVPYFVDAESNRVADAAVSAVTGQTNQFTVSLEGLDYATYTLVVPEGMFQYTKEGKTVQTQAISHQFTIKEIVPEFKKEVWSLIIRPANDEYVKDVALNDFSISISGNIYSGLVPNPDKQIVITAYYDEKQQPVATGHLEVSTPESEGWTTLRLVLDTPILEGQLKPELYVVKLPEAAFGDANFGRWLQDKESVNPSECLVNYSMPITFKVDNSKATGIEVLNMGKKAKSGIYDLTGRKVNDLSRPGIYIVNGKKVVVK